jgi:hypothetical protein
MFVSPKWKQGQVAPQRPTWQSLYFGLDRRFCPGPMMASCRGPFAVSHDQNAKQSNQIMNCVAGSYVCPSVCVCVRVLYLTTCSAVLRGSLLLLTAYTNSKLSAGRRARQLHCWVRNNPPPDSTACHINSVHSPPVSRRSTFILSPTLHLNMSSELKWWIINLLHSGKCISVNQLCTLTN